VFSDRLIKRMKKARSVAVLTGAGVSQESGVATFRGEDGLWKKFKPEELASVEAFVKNPVLVWEWYGYRQKIILKTDPNPGHMALADMEGIFPDFALITQNVDGLHRKAGSQKILELHGNILVSRCMSCGTKSDRIEPEEDGMVPRCACGGRMRPDVVWFGEMLPQDILSQAFEAAERSDVFFSIGTSAVVHPAASLPVAAKEAGAYVVEINPERTVLSGALDETIIGKSGEVLPRLVSRLRESGKEA